MMTTRHGNIEITSEATVTPDYRQAYVAGRRFDMMKHTGRAGAYGRRYTYTKWVITERTVDCGTFITDVDAPSEPGTIKAAYRAIFLHISKNTACNP